MPLLSSTWNHPILFEYSNPATESYILSFFFSLHDFCFYSCDRGWTGAHCETNRCEKFCAENGTCEIDEKGDPMCHCKSGYTGEKCDTPITKCTPRYCKNAGRCVQEGEIMMKRVLYSGHYKKGRPVYVVHWCRKMKPKHSINFVMGAYMWQE